MACKMIGEISKEESFQYILPPLPTTLEDKVEVIFETLKQNRTFNSETNCWTCFPKDPGVAKEVEYTVFQPLEDIFEAVVKAALGVDPNLQQNFSLVVDGNATPTSEQGGDLHPDAFLKISDKALKEMAKNMEELMKKDGWEDVPKTLEMMVGGNWSMSSAVGQSQQATHTVKKEPPSIYKITSPQEFKKDNTGMDVNDVSPQEYTTSLFY